MAQCPKCSRPITHVIIEPVLIGPAESPEQWRGLTYSCRQCHAILSVGPDLAAVQEDTVAMVAQTIGESESRLAALLKRRTKN